MLPITWCYKKSITFKSDIKRFFLFLNVEEKIFLQTQNSHEFVCHCILKRMQNNIHNATTLYKNLLEFIFEVTENICVMMRRAKNSYWCFCFQLYRCWTWETKSWKTIFNVDIHDLWKYWVHVKTGPCTKVVWSETKIVVDHFSLQKEKITKLLFTF